MFLKYPFSILPLSLSWIGSDTNLMQNEGWLWPLLCTDKCVVEAFIDYTQKTTKWQWKDPLTHGNRAKKSFLCFLMMLVSGYFNALLTMINVQCLPDYAHTVFLAVPMIVPQSLNLQRSKDTPYTFDEVTANFKEGKQKTTFWNTSTCIESNEIICCKISSLHGVRLSLYRALNYLNGYILITSLIKEHVLIISRLNNKNRRQNT